MKKINLSLVLAAALLATSVSAQQTKRNLVANGNFENGTSNWRFQYFEGAESILKSETTSPISGTTSAQIEVVTQGTNAWSTMFYYMFPVENQAKYKITWKAKASEAFDMHFELCQKHDNYMPLTAVDAPASFKSDDAVNTKLMRGSVSLTTEPQEFTFTTDGTQLPDGGMMLAFHFGHAPVGVKVWLDDVKISRCDDGDWDGNLAPYGDFEQVWPIQKCGDDDTYKVACCISDAGVAAGDYIDTDANGINGQSFHAHLGAATAFWDFAPWLCWYANENCTYNLKFSAKASLDGARMSVRTATAPWSRGSKPGDHMLVDPTLSTTPAQYTVSMQNGLWGDGAGATSSVFDSGADGNYYGLQKCFISLSEPGFAQTTPVDIWMDDFKVFEDNLVLEDFDLLNVPTTMNVGGTTQMKVGDFVKPTHAPCKINFTITEGSNLADIDENGVITAKAAGTVKFKASDEDGNVSKDFSFTIAGGNAIEPAHATSLYLYPNVVKAGAVINVSEQASVKVYNIKGELLINKADKKLIDTESLVPGIYFAVLSDGSKTTNARFVVK
ncbi:MAG: T9SS type A sorting domain-containing protein [Bacteroidota bacterium]|nr:T9SS type A sorting domain-containing protein [Bacteroidota bacterium]